MTVRFSTYGAEKLILYKVHYASETQSQDFNRGDV